MKLSTEKKKTWRGFLKRIRNLAYRDSDYRKIIRDDYKKVWRKTADHNKKIEKFWINHGVEVVRLYLHKSRVACVLVT